LDIDLNEEHMISLFRKTEKDANDDNNNNNNNNNNEKKIEKTIEMKKRHLILIFLQSTQLTINEIISHVLNCNTINNN